MPLEGHLKEKLPILTKDNVKILGGLFIFIPLKYNLQLGLDYLFLLRLIFPIANKIFFENKNGRSMWWYSAQRMR